MRLNRLKKSFILSPLKKDIATLLLYIFSIESKKMHKLQILFVIIFIQLLLTSCIKENILSDQLRRISYISIIENEEKNK